MWKREGGGGKGGSCAECKYLCAIWSLVVAWEVDC